MGEYGVVKKLFVSIYQNEQHGNVLRTELMTELASLSKAGLSWRDIASELGCAMVTLWRVVNREHDYETALGRIGKGLTKTPKRNK